MRQSFAAAALVAVVCSASVLGAQPRAKSAQDAANDQYQRGVQAYNLERFDEAIAAFSRAYELDPAPILLYNIAQARWKKGESERALFYYRRYLEADPTAENRAAVEARIREIEQARQPPPAAAALAPPPAAVATAAPAPAPSYLQASPPPTPAYRRPLFWGIAAGAAAAAVIGVLLVSAGGSSAGCKECRSTIPVPAP